MIGAHAINELAKLSPTETIRLVEKDVCRIPSTKDGVAAVPQSRLDITPADYRSFVIRRPSTSCVCRSRARAYQAAARWSTDPHRAGETSPDNKATITFARGLNHQDKRVLPLSYLASSPIMSLLDAGQSPAMIIPQVATCTTLSRSEFQSMTKASLALNHCDSPLDSLGAG
jgi:hypothetical protein